MVLKLKNILTFPEEVQKAFESVSEEKQKEILETNIYELITYDVPFSITDHLANQLGGYSPTDSRRLSGAVGTVVYNFLQNGSTTWRIAKPIDSDGVIKGYKNGIKEELSTLLLNHDHLFPIKNEIEWVYDQFDTYVPLLNDGIFNQALHHAVSIFKENGRKVLELNEYNGRTRLIYKPVYWSEIHIANRLKAIMENESLIPKNELQQVINGLDSELNKEQHNACVTALNNKVTFITGGAGVGKTFVIKSLVTSIIENSSNIRLNVVAPTGRASLNIQESLMETGSEKVRKYMSEYEASTVHRLLKLKASEFKGGARSKYNYKNNPLDTNFIIIDEASMIDTILMNNLLWALPNNAHVVVVGDPNQLASVGAGQVLYDLTVQINYGKQFKNLEIDRPKWVHLTEVQRTSLDTNLPLVSKSLLTANKSERWSNFESEFDEAIGIGSINFIETKDIVDTVCDIYLKNRDSIILTPRHNGENGGRVDINNAIMSKLGFTGYQVGVPVVQNKTNYDKGVLNGERGVITEVNVDEEIITILFEGGQSVTYYIKDVDNELIVAYATTVHKSQGSEADTVILPIWTVNEKSVWDVSLLYTALTRAKKIVYIIGSIDDLRLSMDRSKNNHRFTMLPHRYKTKFEV